MLKINFDGAFLSETRRGAWGFFLLSETIKGEGAVHNLRGRSTSGRSEIRTAPGYIYCRRGNGLAESADGSQSGHV
jgi:hypothetical protein